MSNRPTLCKDALSHILSLHSKLPDELLAIWVTSNEICDRLVEGGVSHDLKCEHVSCALKIMNRGQRLMQTRVEGNIKYFRPNTFELDGSVPSDQRTRMTGLKTRGLPLLPERNYFLLRQDSSSIVSLLNECLEDHVVAVKEYDIDEAKSKQEKGKSTAQYILSVLHRPSPIEFISFKILQSNRNRNLKIRQCKLRATKNLWKPRRGSKD